MTLKEKIKTIVFALRDNKRTILLDYAQRSYAILYKIKIP